MKKNLRILRARFIWPVKQRGRTKLLLRKRSEAAIGAVIVFAWKPPISGCQCKSAAGNRAA